MLVGKRKTKRIPEERKLSKEEFVIVAIRALRHENGSNHFSTRLNGIAGAFKRYFGEKIEKTLNQMIEDGKIWALHLVWSSRSNCRGSKLTSADCLESFPDPQISAALNPTLYIDGEIPKRILPVLARSPRKMLSKILQFVEKEQKQKVH